MTRTSVCPLKGYHRLFLTNIADCCRLKNIADCRRLILKLSLMTKNLVVLAAKKLKTSFLALNLVGSGDMH